MACDICGKSAECEDLSSQLDWTLEKAMIICRSCAKTANTLLDKYRHMAWVRTKKKLMKMQKTYRKAPTHN